MEKISLFGFRPWTIQKKYQATIYDEFEKHRNNAQKKLIDIFAEGK